ncbi:MAG: helix-turn-helix transcriptional regulator [Vicinamibacterales bacterium]
MDRLLTVEQAGRRLGVSRSTIWRRIQRGELKTVRRGGRRLVYAPRVAARADRRAIPALTDDHPIFRLVGAGRGGGALPGARDKHALLDQ